MPASASASIIVTDNDTVLSSDAYRYESSGDTSWQKAEIRVNGEIVASDVRIYAEEYYTVRDQYERTYKLGRDRGRGPEQHGSHRVLRGHRRSAARGQHP